MAEKKSGFLTFFTSLPGIITAIATLITAVGGLLVAIDKFGNDWTSTQSTQSPSPTPSKTKGTTPTPAVTPSSSAPKEEQTVDYTGVRVKGTVTAKIRNVVYLSDGTTGADYKNGDYLVDSADPTQFLRMYGGLPVFDEFAAISGEVSKQSCAKVLAHHVGEFRAKPADEGTWLCVIRTDSSYGAIHIDKVDLAEGALTVSYVVWR